MESFHHPKEDEFLFKAVRARTREADHVLATLQQQHAEMPGQFRDLRLALGGERQGAASQLDDFSDLIGRFADSQIEHMRLESGVFALLGTQRVGGRERVQRVEFLDDIVFQANVNEQHEPGSKTHELLIRKGSVLVFVSEPGTGR